MPSTSSRRLLAVPGKIDVVPFTGFPEIVKLDLSKYEGIMQLLRNKINASPDLEEAVNTAILNLFINSPQKVVSEGKNYNKYEREYNHNQLMEYLHKISCVEIDASFATRLGNFANKETSIRNALPNTIHLAYFDDRIKFGQRLSEETKELENTVTALEPKGVLIFNPAEKREIKEMKYLGNFGRFGMYQKA
jgi:hypothetical protein